MKDHHVDRPGVEVGQPMKLTGSDRPIDSDPVARDHARRDVASYQRQRPTARAADPRQQHSINAGTPPERYARGQPQAAPLGKHITHQNLAALQSPPRARTGSRLTRRLKSNGEYRQPLHGLDDLVALAGGPHPIPSRTRP